MLIVDEVTFAHPGLPLRLSLEVARGVCCAVIGPSGAGKSTLLDLIAGFLQPDSGRILIEGKDVTAQDPALRPVTTLFQDHNLFAHLDAFTNVGLGLDPGLRLDSEQYLAVREALARVGLWGMERRLPGQLSGGERQRVALARALVRDRPLLLLDEPFAALGPALRVEMLDLVDELRRDRGTTVVLVSHQPEDARRIAEETAFLEAGEIVAKGPTAALLDRPPPSLAAYLGSGGA